MSQGVPPRGTAQGYPPGVPPESIWGYPHKATPIDRGGVPEGVALQRSVSGGRSIQTAARHDKHYRNRPDILIDTMERNKTATYTDKSSKQLVSFKVKSPDDVERSPADETGV